jgi:uroporphyrinogen-III synthase
VSALSGRRVVLTRRRGSSAELVERLRGLGAEVVEVPAIEVVPPADPGPLDEALLALERYAWVVFTSPNAVSAVLGRIAVLGLAPRVGARGRRLASVGPSTTAALSASFPADRVSLQPAADFRAAGLVEAFAREDLRGARVLVPASARARDELSRGLSAQGAEVDLAAAYDVVEPPDLADAVRGCLAAGLDLALFASPSAVESFAHSAGEAARGLPAAVIGPTTEAAARACGMRVLAVARPSTGEALAAAAEEALSGLTGRFAPLTPSQ